MKYVLIAYFLGNIFAKNRCNRAVFVKIIASQRWDVFWDTMYIQQIFGGPSRSQLIHCSKKPTMKYTESMHFMITDRTARCQFQATGQPVSRTQASDAVTSRLSRYEAKCV